MVLIYFFFFNDTATTEIYTLSLHDALPILAWLERFLKEYPGTVVAITHDRYFLDNVAGWILELDRGHGIPWEGNYSSWLEQKQERLEGEGKAGAASRRARAGERGGGRVEPRAPQANGKARLTKY